MKPSDFYYCPICQVERPPQSLVVEKTEKSIDVCTNLLTGGYLDKYEYKKEIRIIYNYKCPKCNYILKTIDFIK